MVRLREKEGLFSAKLIDLYILILLGSVHRYSDSLLVLCVKSQNIFISVLVPQYCI